MIEWAVWYSDGTSATSEEAEPHEVPRWGVICITQRSRDHGRTLWCGKDYFWWAGEWLNGDMTGLLDYLGNHPGPEKVILFGRMLPPSRYHEICKLALEDSRLPEKTSTDWLESNEI